MNGRILLIEDEELVGTMVRMNLESSGYEVRWSRHGLEGQTLSQSEPFDLILIDISLPGRNGMEILGDVRKSGVSTPIMMLTARSDVRTKVEALQAGADDYLPKPFDVAELIARVHALVRRSQSEREIPTNRLVRFGPYEINLETREAKTNDGTQILSEKEVELMKLLIRARGRTLSRSDILEEVWGMDVAPTGRTVDNFIMRLRRFFEPEPDQPRHIITVRGAGYRFVP
jgi:two-component system, OmpR family, alkaline phosphatase synthesis response regulator PhoP